ncbi:arginyltransferase [Psychromonas sp. RZ22]|uniref:arginyltransferase n=1 Tax=Psychromonas algarum TaxID=2555643 RepID=UPI0010689ABC|nr:arginyltransferase [Psychromonas sp. RZ22]TEW53399.1 arginyltransferase [Psychromonas sp. RZ22]
MSKTSSLRATLSTPFPCSYLTDKEEQLIMLFEPEHNAQQYYPALITMGFRRSGDQVYRPQCPDCEQCQSLRIQTNEFILSKSQKRLLNKNKHFTVIECTKPKADYFSLYQHYINTIHKNGVMYPASIEQFESFIACSWGAPIFIEIYDGEKLISVSVTDQLTTNNSTSWSAFYCFYDPNYTAHSLGKFAVLQQLQLAKTQNIDFLYLGYYIHNCQKMNYKNQFNPHQRFINQKWEAFD